MKMAGRVPGLRFLPKYGMVYLALSVTVGGCPSSGGSFLPPDLTKEGLLMITYSELFQFCLVIIGICGLFIQVYKKK